MVTANGLLRILVMLAEGKAFSPALSRHVMDVLHRQVDSTEVPGPAAEGSAGCPQTGEISTIAHDAGVVYFRNESPTCW